MWVPSSGPGTGGLLGSQVARAHQGALPRGGRVAPRAGAGGVPADRGEGCEGTGGCARGKEEPASLQSVVAQAGAGGSGGEAQTTSGRR